MGRSNPTLREQLRSFEEEWQLFRRALRKPHQEPFDELLEKADQFAGAIGNQNPPYAYQGIFLAMALGLEIEQERLAERVDELEGRVEELAEAVEDAL